MGLREVRFLNHQSDCSLPVIYICVRDAASEIQSGQLDLGECQNCLNFFVISVVILSYPIDHIDCLTIFGTVIHHKRDICNI